jgi:hypothetical protein
MMPPSVKARVAKVLTAQDVIIARGMMRGEIAITEGNAPGIVIMIKTENGLRSKDARSGIAVRKKAKASDVE